MQFIMLICCLYTEWERRERSWCRTAEWTRASSQRWYRRWTKELGRRQVGTQAAARYWICSAWEVCRWSWCFLLNCHFSSWCYEHASPVRAPGP